MSDYQRFITYINLYENDDKRKNVGFAKIEKRKEQCRFEIHMKNIGYTGQSSQIYFYVRREQELECIPVGNLQIINGIADRRIMLNGDNIAGSGHGLGEISGLVIFLNEQIMLASQWKEGEMLRRLFRLPGQEAAKGEIVEESESPSTQSTVPTQNPAVASTAPVQTRTSAVPTAPAQPRASAASAAPAQRRATMAPAAPMQTRPTAASTTSAQNQQAIPAAAPTVRVVPLSEPPAFTKEEPSISGKAEAAASVRAGAPSSVRAEAPSSGRTEAPASGKAEIPSSDRAEAPASQSQEQPDSLHVAEAAVNPAARPWSATWQMMLESYPVLTPFEGEEDICCIRIELKELRMLPRRYWYLGNNSFLLHGFFNYRYLILGQMQVHGVKRWFLGVPGVFQNQEKVMAAIFGFPEFKAEKTAKQKTNQFGYWYRFMDESY